MVRRGNSRESWLAEVQRRASAIRAKLRHCVIFLNGKGGTGKTSTCANCAATLARALVEGRSKRRVLVMEFDVQGNLKSEFGFKSQPGDDNGQSILNAVMGTGPLQVVRDVRPLLDMVPAGQVLEKLVKMLAAATDQDRTEYWLQLGEAVAGLADEYEWILVDCSPGDEQLQLLAMVLAQFIIVPTVFDKASRYGLEAIGRLFESVEDVNDEVDVLGIAMFGFERRDQRPVKDPDTSEIVDYKETGQTQRLRAALTRDLAEAESDAVVFESVIAASKVAGEICREAGVTAAELADLVASDEWPKVRKELAAIERLGGNVNVSVATAEALATDYENLTIEAFTRIQSLEASR